MTSHRADYIHLGNLTELEEMFQRFQKDPASLDPSWRYFFEGMEWGSRRATPFEEGAFKESRIAHLIDHYRTKGHLLAKINPLKSKQTKELPEFDLKTLGFKKEELKDFFPTLGLKEEKEATLEEIISILKDIYSRNIGVEYKNLELPEMESYLQQKIEKNHFRPTFSKERKQEILHQLNKASIFENFLHTKYVGQKRFSLEGAETLIPLLHTLIEKGAESGINEFLIGMPHRGRLNVLTSILNKSFATIFREFEGIDYLGFPLSSGDVKYHKGFSATVKTSHGKEVHISLTANPSHLEAVDPVVLGKTRAKQDRLKDNDRLQVLPIIIHGDASIAGQGVVYECLQLSKLEGYKTGGTIHIVVNNQIGFTTIPEDSRSTIYSTDIAKGFSQPVFHVNAEDPEGAVYSAELSLEIRQKFHSDVFIDMYCYRKYGHNEGDEPFFTQPVEYKEIRNKKPIREIYRDKLMKEGAVEKEEVENLEDEFQKNLHDVLEGIKTKEVIPDIEEKGIWKSFRQATKEDIFRKIETAVLKDTLKEIAKRFSKVPDNFNLHPKIQKLFETKTKAVLEETVGKNINWGLAETLSLASLLWQKIPVRLSGEDSRRGTFSQRHAIWVDQKTDNRYTPLAHLSPTQADFYVFDSPLSEYALLGFEFGYSLASPETLVLWEAQYGDFANGGQIIIDQFLAASEQKWNRFSGLVLLLPHGFEGQGPEHSSARMERFLQLSGDDNMQIVNPTTPSQYFHLLRRQILRDFRKPLIIFTPKQLLRHPLCMSSLEDLTRGTFEEILDDDIKNKEIITRIVLLSGRIYYDILEERALMENSKVALVRLEELYPLHEEKLKEIVQSYPNAKELFWVQEEPINMGAASYMHEPFYRLFGNKFKIEVIGRKRSAAPATGSHKVHVKEQLEIIKKALDG